MWLEASAWVGTVKRNNKKCTVKQWETSFIMFACLSVCTEQLGFHWTDFHEIWYLNIFRKYVKQIQVSLKSVEKISVFYTKTYANLWFYLADFFLEWKIFQTKVTDKIKTHVSCPPSLFFPRKSCLLRDNVEKCFRTGVAVDDNIIPRMRFACWITKARNTHSEYVILIAFHGNKG